MLQLLEDYSAALTHCEQALKSASRVRAFFPVVTFLSRLITSNVCKSLLSHRIIIDIFINSHDLIKFSLCLSFNK